MSLHINTGNAKSKLKDRGDDFYETPQCTINALMRVEKLPQVIWEPACGRGAIVTALRQSGHMVYATDLVNYNCPDSEHGVDFLMERAPSFAVGGIVTNPPYKNATAFVRHALLLGIPKIFMLLRINFLESQGRADIFESGLLSRLHIFCDRQPMMHREGRGAHTGNKINSSGMSLGWFVFEQGNTNPTTIDWIWGRRK